MKTLIFVIALVLTQTSFAQDGRSMMCKAQARMAEDIANMLNEGLSPDKINFVNPAKPSDNRAQNQGNFFVEEIQRMLGEDYTPKEIRDDIMNGCMKPGDIKT